MLAVLKVLVVVLLEATVAEVVPAELELCAVVPAEEAELLVLGAAVELVLEVRVLFVVPDVELVLPALVVPVDPVLADDAVVGAALVLLVEVLVFRVVPVLAVVGAAVDTVVLLLDEFEEDTRLLLVLLVELVDAVLGAAVVALDEDDELVLLRLGAAVLVDALLDDELTEVLDELSVLLDEVELLLRELTVLAVEFWVPCVELVEFVVLELDELFVGVVARNVPRKSG